MELFLKWFRRVRYVHGVGIWKEIIQWYTISNLINSVICMFPHRAPNSPKVYQKDTIHWSNVSSDEKDTFFPAIKTLTVWQLFDSCCKIKLNPQDRIIPLFGRCLASLFLPILLISLQSHGLIAFCPMIFQSYSFYLIVQVLCWRFVIF